MTSDVPPRRTTRNLGSLGAQIDIPEGWSLTANGAGFFLVDDNQQTRLSVWTERTAENMFDRLPRSGPGIAVTESVLPSSARFYRRADAEGTAVFVDLALGNGRSLVCSCGPDLEPVCVSLRRAPT